MVTKLALSLVGFFLFSGGAILITSSQTTWTVTLAIEVLVLLVLTVACGLKAIHTIDDANRRGY